MDLRTQIRIYKTLHLNQTKLLYIYIYIPQWKEDPNLWKNAQQKHVVTNPRKSSETVLTMGSFN